MSFFLCGPRSDVISSTPRRIGIQQVVTTESTNAQGRVGVLPESLNPELDDDDPNNTNMFLFVRVSTWEDMTLLTMFPNRCCTSAHYWP